MGDRSMRKSIVQMAGFPLSQVGNSVSSRVDSYWDSDSLSARWFRGWPQGVCCSCTKAYSQSDMARFQFAVIGSLPFSPVEMARSCHTGALRPSGDSCRRLIESMYPAVGAAYDPDAASMCIADGPSPTGIERSGIGFRSRACLGHLWILLEPSVAGN